MQEQEGRRTFGEDGDGKTLPAGGARRRRLSKSSVAAFEQCPKRLWLSVHRPELSGADDASDRAKAGHSVGEIARGLVAGGVLIEGEDLASALARTGELLASGGAHAVFEATFAVDGLLVRADILEADGRGGWRIVEVKSATSVKDHYRGDLATQIWAAIRAGVRVTGAAVRHVDRTFVLTSPGAYEGAFVDVELLDALADVVAGRAAVIEAAHAALDGPEPTRSIGAHCTDPHECEFAEHCRAATPRGPEWPVTVLPNGGGKKWLKAGVGDLLAVPEAGLSNPTHLKVHRATSTGITFHDRAGACGAIDAWRFPRTWLDFETIAFPLPRWVGVRAYEQVPFQFSAHVEHTDGRLEHVEFLSLDGADPRRACAEALAGLPGTGAVVAYNASFERGCIERLAKGFPDLAPALLGLSGRLVDLLPVARANWYHRDQRGSWSIKAVLPTVTDLSYDDLEVRNGVAAQSAYLEATAGATPERVALLDEALRRYCARDTEAMIALARRLVTDLACR